MGKSYGALAVGVVAIAWSAIFVRWAQMPGVTTGFYRMLIASMVLWPILLTSKAKVSGCTGSTYMLAALSGVFFAGDIAMFNTAVMHTSAGSAMFLSNNVPLLVGLFTWAMTRKMPSGRFWTALAIATTGAWLIISEDIHHAASQWSADMMAVAASVCFAMYLLLTERLRKDMAARVLVTIAASGSAVGLLVVGVVGHLSFRIPSMQSLACLIAMALVCQVLGYFCLTYALGQLPATVTSVMMLATAPLTALFAFWFFGERMTLLKFAGGFLVMLGVWVVSRVPVGVESGEENEGVLEVMSQGHFD